MNDSRRACNCSCGENPGKILLLLWGRIRCLVARQGSDPCLALGILQGLSWVALSLVIPRKCKGNFSFHDRRKERDFFWQLVRGEDLLVREDCPSRLLILMLTGTHWNGPAEQDQGFVFKKFALFCFLVVRRGRWWFGGGPLLLVLLGFLWLLVSYAGEWCSLWKKGWDFKSRSED